MKHLRLALFLSLSINTGVLHDHASAQFGNEWAGFTDETATRLALAPDAISSNGSEVDFAWGDLDKDGFVDLVAVRKQPFTTGGKRRNYLLMNNGGVLTDGTVAYASQSTTPGDQGFVTATNDRDVVITDVDLDGWLDVVTATTLSAGDPKHLSHPRVYMNLGESGGSWQGLRHEDARIPQLKNGTTDVAPGFCAVAAGDVTGNGYPDLFFSDYSGSASGLPHTIDDRLLINDGNGFFTDESTLRMTAQMLDTGFGTSTSIVDLNGDGHADVVKNWAAAVRAIYNNKNQPGFFNLYTSPYGGAAYHTNTGDLNNDGRIDLIISDDGSDRHVYNLGTDAFGGVEWGPFKTFQFLAGSDDGFGGNNLIIDVDNDGWNDGVIADVDVDISGCGRRIHIYRNPGGLVGQQITLREERESASGGWLGVKGPLQNDLKGGYDVAVFDINNDGSNDLVFGRCAGTYVWMNEATCQEDLGHQGPGVSYLSICGGDLSTGNGAELRLNASAPNQLALLFVGVAANPTFVNDLGGTLVPIPVVAVLPFVTDNLGSIRAPVPGGGGPVDVYAQFVIADLGQPKGYQVSNGLKIHLDP